MHKNTWFISDTHFCHKNILTLGKGRPFKTIEEMETTIINNINKVVREEDTLIFLGDTCFGTSKQVKEFLARIKCKNTIEIVGNHSKQGLSHFKFTAHRMLIKIANQYVLLCHYPYRLPWYKRIFNRKIKDSKRRPEDRGFWLIHGHRHGGSKVVKKQINVSVDCWDFKPVPIQAIANIIQQYPKGLK